MIIHLLCAGIVNMGNVLTHFTLELGQMGFWYYHFIEEILVLE